MTPVRIWDLPTRVFHWSLTVCVVGLIVTANLGGGWMNWHLRLGYAVLTLLLFRLIWGFVGGRWSRFMNFLYTPSQLMAYLRGQAPPEHRAGHTPLGALSVFALLAALLAQVGSGLFSDDEIAFFGPLVRFVSNDTVQLATTYHKDIGKVVILALVATHLLALLFYRVVRGQRLVGPMVHGDKMLDTPLPSAHDRVGTRLLALALLAVCAAFVGWLVSLGGGF